MSKKMNFKRILLCAIFLIASVIDVSAYSSNISHGKRDVIEDVINAIVYVESRGHLNVRSGSCCGPMQISPVLVKCCNQILKEQGSSKRYSLSDRFNLQKSKEMFRLINKKYNPSFNIEKAIRSWNGGIHYKVRKTNGYYRKVMKRYNEQLAKKLECEQICEDDVQLPDSIK